MSNDLPLEDIINDMLAAAADEKAAEKATPTMKVKRNPWLYQGWKVVTSKVHCTNCNAEQELSHGFVQCFQHKDDPEKLWSTQMERNTQKNPDPEEFLGFEQLQSSTIYGCTNCFEVLVSLQMERKG